MPTFFEPQKATKPVVHDPYAADRPAMLAREQARMDALNRARTEYEQALASPSWGLPDPEMQKFLESKTIESVRSQYPMAGRSGWLADRENSELLKLRLGFVEQRQQALNKLRDLQANLLGQQTPGAPTQYVAGQPGGPSPFQTVATKAAGQFAGAGAEEFARDIFGRKKSDTGGMAVKFSPNTSGKTPNLYNEAV